MTPTATGVVLVSFEAPDDTLACLDSLERSQVLDLEIVVVDNGPADSPHHARLLAGVAGRATVIASGENLGYAAGNNLGLRHLMESGLERFWLLNPDTEVGPGTLTRLLAHLEAVPDCGIVGPRLVIPFRRPEIWYDGAVVDRATGATRLLNGGLLETDVPPGLPRDTDYVSGASLLVRRSVVDQVGLLPEEYFLYFEETAWCLSALERGWRVMVEPRARMVHHKRSSPGRVPAPYYVYYVTRNRFHFAQRVLGVDGEAGWADFDTHLESWRAKLRDHAPHRLADYEALVVRAKQDARAGVLGRSEGISELRFAEEDR